MCRPRSTLLLQAALCVVLALAFSGGVTRVEAADNIALQWYELQDRVLFAPLGSGPVRGPNRVRNPTPLSFLILQFIFIYQNKQIKIDVVTTKGDSRGPVAGHLPADFGRLRCLGGLRLQGAWAPVC
jgi:hypothetical protein